jgi:hypothetical protein
MRVPEIDAPPALGLPDGDSQGAHIAHGPQASESVHEQACSVPTQTHCVSASVERGSGPASLDQHEQA